MGDSDCTCGGLWIPKRFEITDDEKKDTSKDIIEYYPSGSLKSAKKYSNYGQSDCGCFYGFADYEEYYENGNLKCKGIYLWEDSKSYDWHYYYEGGHWEKTEHYYNGRKEFDGPVTSICTYLSREKHGKMKLVDKEWVTLYEKDNWTNDESC